MMELFQLLAFSLCLGLIVLPFSKGQDDSAGQPRGQHCRGYNPGDVPYPSPYIRDTDRTERCKQLFSKFNSSGTVNIHHIGKNTYHNPCKVECPLCEEELPSQSERANVIRSFPAHIHFVDDIAQCPGKGSIEIFEQYLEDGYQCGRTHVCDDKCCVNHPELFPNVRQKKTTTSRPTPSNDWTIPLTCEEEGYFRNPNDCHRFYLCHEVKKKFVTTLFSCNPLSLVFDDQFKVCVSPDDTTQCSDLDPNAEN